MAERTQESDSWLEWAHELLFSLNLSWLVVWVGRTRESYAGHGVSLFMRRVHLHVSTLEPETVLNQIVWTIFIAAIVFLLVRLLSHLSVSRAILGTLAGACALAGFPLVALEFPLFFFQKLAYEGRFAVRAVWLFCELASVLLCALFYYLRKWPIPGFVGVALLILHFAFWSWLTGTYRNLFSEAHIYGGFLNLGFWVSALFFWGFPVLGLLSSLTWGVYVKKPTQRETVASALT